MTSDTAFKAASMAVMTAMLERPGSDGYVDGYEDYARAALEAAAPHMMAGVEDKLAAIIVLLDPFERVTNWMTTDDEAGRYAVEAINKIRALLDATP